MAGDCLRRSGKRSVSERETKSSRESFTGEETVLRGDRSPRRLPVHHPTPPPHPRCFQAERVAISIINLPIAFMRIIIIIIVVKHTPSMEALRL